MTTERSHFYEKVIADALDSFHKKRTEKLASLKLKDILKRKNPYLLRALGIKTAAELVAGVIDAFMSASDETIFGNSFFEPVAKKVANGEIASSEGVDLIIQTAEVYKAVAIKSGPNIFNASQKKRQADEFRNLRQRLQNRINKTYEPVLGHCYGYKPNSSSSSYRSVAGQAFWEEITGDQDFYLKLSQLMRDRPESERMQYEAERAKVINRFVKEFSEVFVLDDGSINWDKLLQYNSGSDPSVRISFR